MSFDAGTPWVVDNYWVPFTVASGQSVTKGQVVVLNTNGTIQPSEGVSRLAIGVALKNGNAGEAIPVALRGIVRVTAGGAISLGSFVTSGAGGKVLAFADFDAPATYGEAAMQAELNKIGAVIGVALDAASADGDKIRIMLIRF